jgi:hypothetical protein
MLNKKLLYVSSHLSTGGMPQYLLKQIEIFNDEFDIEIIEVNIHSGGVRSESWSLFSLSHGTCEVPCSPFDRCQSLLLDI